MGQLIGDLPRELALCGEYIAVKAHDPLELGIGVDVSLYLATDQAFIDLALFQVEVTDIVLPPYGI